MKKTLNVTLGMTWTSYAASLFGALKASNMYDKDLVWLMGETGLAFHFIIEQTSCPSGPTVYNWQQEHLDMADRIGIATDICMMHKDPKYNTFDITQKHAIDLAKASINNGVPPIVWAPSPVLEFGILTGYDDEDGVFFTEDCSPMNADPLLFENLGLSEVSILYVQSCYAKTEYDGEKTLRNSLAYALDHWKSEFHVAPNYAAGKKAWDNLIGTLERKDFDGFGLTYTMNLYADSKRKIHEFLKAAADKYQAFEKLKSASESSQTTAVQMERIASMLPFKGPGMSSADEVNIPSILECARKACEAEEHTMSVIEDILS